MITNTIQSKFEETAVLNKQVLHLLTNEDVKQYRMCM